MLGHIFLSNLSVVCPRLHSDRTSSTVVIYDVADVANEVCPHCSKPARFLPQVSNSVGLDYYTCDGCGKFWCIEPPQPTRAVPHATIALPGLRSFLAAIFRKRRS